MKHRVFFYGKHWYAICGTCARVMYASRWLPAWGHLEGHVWGHLTTIEKRGYVRI